MAQEKTSYQDIFQQIQSGRFAPVYLLMGEEPYYTGQLTDCLENAVLKPGQEAFNKVVFYGKDLQVETLLNELRQYPMGAEHRLVMVKEMQTMDEAEKRKLEQLKTYFDRPTPTTVLVLSCKGAKFDARMSWVKQAGSVGVCYNSEKISESQLPSHISMMAKRENLQLIPEAMQLMVECIGADLGQIAQTLRKIRILQTDNNRVNLQSIENATGISKDYNAFELTNALSERDETRCMRIIAHTTAPIQMITVILFNFYANLITYQYLVDKSDRNACAVLGCAPFALIRIKKAASLFSPMQSYKAIGFIRNYDARSKGFGSNVTDSTELLKELVFKILH